MNGTTIGRDHAEEQMLAYEISDEALESAAGTAREKAKNMTLFFLHLFRYLPGSLNRRENARAGVRFGTDGSMM